MPSSISRALAHRLQPYMYYGWVIVAVVLVSNLVTFSISVTFGLYVTPLEQEFGWSRSSISLGYSIGPVAGALAAPFLGMLVDRIGVRVLMPLGSLIGGSCLILLGHISALWQFYVLYGIVFISLYAAIGQLIGNASVTRWFVRRRGRALGIIMMGASAGGMIFIPVQNYLIDTLGWRDAYMIYGVCTMVLAGLPSLFLMGNSPEQFGQEGNKELAPPEQKGNGPAQPSDWTLAQAIRTRQFWTVIAGVMMATVCVSGYFTHVVPYLESVGFTRTEASSAWSFFFLVAMVSKFLWGFVTERLAVRWCLVICMCGEMVGLSLLMNATTVTDLMIFAVVNGLGHGPYLQLLALVWGNYYGRKSIGAILGMAQPAAVFSAAMGPLLGGVLFDHFGHYTEFLWVLFAMAFGASALFLLSPPPGAPPQPREPQQQPSTAP